MADRKTLGSAIDEIVTALEGLDEMSRATAIKAACDHLKLALPADMRSTPTAPSAGSLTIPITASAQPEAVHSPIDIRSFREQKAPTTATEMLSVLAYYLQHLAPAGERKSELVPSDIEKYFVQANFPLPKRTNQALVDAKSAGYFDSAGRGAYRLNAVGSNLVAHSLPRKGGQQGSRAASRSRKATRKKSGNRGKKRKSR